jgi:hypothetical protein
MAGIFRDANLQERVADFSYQNDALAQLIVEAWTDPDFEKWLTTRQSDGTSPNAKASLEARGIFLANPIVFTEEEYNSGCHNPDPDGTGVIFVVPDRSRVEQPPHHLSLLETARLLMAITPNGI